MFIKSISEGFTELDLKQVEKENAIYRTGLGEMDKSVAVVMNSD